MPFTYVGTSKNPAMPPRNKTHHGCCPRGNKAGALPLELLLEIAARSDAAALFRFAATCRLLRREIVSPAFVRRVRDADERRRGGMLLLGFLNESGACASSFSLVHPRTPAAVSFAGDSLAPVLSRGGGLLQRYIPMTSRGGLVLLTRRYSYALKSFKANLPDMCVYDPMTDARTFLPYPPDMGRPDQHDHAYVLLTAADGIGCSFLVVVLKMHSLFDMTEGHRYFTLQATVSGGQWGPAFRGNDPSLPQASVMIMRRQDGAVVLDGVVHWLVMGINDYAVFTYDAVRAKTLRAIKLPQDFGTCCGCGPYLRSSPEGKLSVLGTRGFVVYFWVLSSEGSWARHGEVNTSPMLRPLLEPSELMDCYGNEFSEWPQGIKVQGIGDKRSRVVLLRLPDLRRHSASRRALFVLDMDTMKILKIAENEMSLIPYEVELYSRLSTMKTF